MIASSEVFQAVEVDHIFPGEGQRTLLLDAPSLLLAGPFRAQGSGDFPGHHGEGPPGPGYAEDASRFPRRTGESRRSTRPAAGRAPLIPAYRPTPSCNRSWSRARVSLTATSWSPMYTSDKGSGAAAMPANTGDGVRRTRGANGTLVTARRLVSGCRVVSE